MSGMKRWRVPVLDRSRHEAAQLVMEAFHALEVPEKDDPQYGLKQLAMTQLYHAWEHLWATRYA